MIITNLKSYLGKELTDASKIWIASAMISYEGWEFLKENISGEVIQNYLIGIDLATSPSVFGDLIQQPEISARIFESENTYHPKVYLIQKKDESYCAFIGSSNTTTGGLEKNTEVNIYITNQEECNDLLVWFNELYNKGKIITDNFIEDYKAKFKRTNKRIVENKQDVTLIKTNLKLNDKQFFSYNDHAIFNERYHEIQNDELLNLRRGVREKLIELHEDIYHQFANYGITDLHCHHQSRERVSRHYFNQFSGNYVTALWLHYGKSLPHLQSYAKDDQSFIDHIRVQVIIQEDAVGIWLILGMDGGSKIDRDHFRNEMLKVPVRNNFYSLLKKLDNSYWIDFNGAENRVWVKDINSVKELYDITVKENINYYFVIGCDIDWLDSRLSSRNISMTVLNEISKLFHLYLIMRN